MTAAPRSAPWLGYRAVWRWHFYAGLISVPLILVLALTGAVYLFKPQIEAALDRPYRGLAEPARMLPADRLMMAAERAMPGALVKSYIVPRAAGDAAQLLMAQGSKTTRLYIHPGLGTEMARQDDSSRPMEVVKDIHGELLAGTTGAVLVELAASWGFVMLATGLYLWWPRRRTDWKGIFWPRLFLNGRPYWRDIHATTGFWVSGFALILLATSLPWTGIWGDTFKAVRSHFTEAEADWPNGANAHAGHHMATGPAADMGGNAWRQTPAEPRLADASVTLQQVIDRIRPMGLAWPVEITPPTARTPEWTVRSMAQDRTARVTLRYDAMSGMLLGREDFADKPAVDRVVGVGVALHEGQLFGLANQLLGLLTAAGLMLLAASAILLWWRRRPVGALGAPEPEAAARLPRGLILLLAVLALLLPLLAASLIATALFDRLLLPRLPKLGAWLGAR